MTRSPISPGLWASERARLEAAALVDKQVMVIHEVPTNSGKPIKSSNAYIGPNLRFMPSHKILRRERAQLVLGGAQT